MTDRPILFSAPMILALLAGRKFQTRRLVKIGGASGEILDFVKVGTDKATGRSVYEMKGHGGVPVAIAAGKYFATSHYMPPIAVGDRLWVKESHAIVPRTAYRCSDGIQQVLRPNDDHDAAVFAAGWERSKPGRWRPSIHMPRWASRLTLIIEDVRIERLQDISEEDAIAEGIEPFLDFAPYGHHWKRYRDGGCNGYVDNPIGSYASLWTEINGAGSWEANPFVAAYSFKFHHCNIDAMAEDAR